MKNNLLCGITVGLMMGSALNGSSRDRVSLCDEQFHLSVFKTCYEGANAAYSPVTYNSTIKRALNVNIAYATPGEIVGTATSSPKTPEPAFLDPKGDRSTAGPPIEIRNDSRELVFLCDEQFHLTVYNTCVVAELPATIPVVQKAAIIPPQIITVTAAASVASKDISSDRTGAHILVPRVDVATTTVTPVAPSNLTRGLVELCDEQFHMSVYRTCYEDLNPAKAPRESDFRITPALNPTQTSTTLGNINWAAITITRKPGRPLFVTDGVFITENKTIKPNSSLPEKQISTPQIHAEKPTRTGEGLHSLLFPKIRISGLSSIGRNPGTISSGLKSTDHSNDLVYAIGQLKVIAGSNFTRALFRIAAVPRMPVPENKFGYTPMLLSAKWNNNSNNVDLTALCGLTAVHNRNNFNTSITATESAAEKTNTAPLPTAAQVSTEILAGNSAYFNGNEGIYTLAWNKDANNADNNIDTKAGSHSNLLVDQQSFALTTGNNDLVAARTAYKSFKNISQWSIMPMAIAKANYVPAGKGAFFPTSTADRTFMIISAWSGPPGS